MSFELRQMSQAILARQDETDAKLDSSAMEVRQLREEVADVSNSLRRDHPLPNKNDPDKKGPPWIKQILMDWLPVRQAEPL